MKFVNLRLGVKAPDNTDPAIVAEAINRALDESPETGLYWDDWTVGAVLIDTVTAPGTANVETTDEDDSGESGLSEPVPSPATRVMFYADVPEPVAEQLRLLGNDEALSLSLPSGRTLVIRVAPPA